MSMGGEIKVSPVYGSANRFVSIIGPDAVALACPGRSGIMRAGEVAAKPI